MAAINLRDVSKAMRERIKRRAAMEGKWPRTWLLEVISAALKQPPGAPLANPEVKIPYTGPTTSGGAC